MRGRGRVQEFSVEQGGVGGKEDTAPGAGDQNTTTVDGSLATKSADSTPVTTPEKDVAAGRVPVLPRYFEVATTLHRGAEGLSPTPTALPTKQTRKESPPAATVLDNLPIATAAAAAATERPTDAWMTDAFAYDRAWDALDLHLLGRGCEPPAGFVDHIANHIRRFFAGHAARAVPRGGFLTVPWQLQRFVESLAARDGSMELVRQVFAAFDRTCSTAVSPSGSLPIFTVIDNMFNDLAGPPAAVTEWTLGHVEPRRVAQLRVLARLLRQGGWEAEAAGWRRKRKSRCGRSGR
jgi:hypothetical protein